MPIHIQEKTVPRRSFNSFYSWKIRISSPKIWPIHPNEERMGRRINRYGKTEGYPSSVFRFIKGNHGMEKFLFGFLRLGFFRINFCASRLGAFWKAIFPLLFRKAYIFLIYNIANKSKPSLLLFKNEQQFQQEQKNDEEMIENSMF